MDCGNRRYPVPLPADILPHAHVYGPGQVLFCVAAARHEKRSQPDSKAPFRLHRNPAQFIRVLVSQDGHRKRVLKYQRGVVELVSRPAQGYPQRGPGWGCLIHQVPESTVD